MIEAKYKNVIVKVHYEEKINTIILPEYQSVKKQVGKYWGEVISIGKDNTLGIKVGDKILFQRSEGMKIEYKGEGYMSLKQDYIEGVFV